jgi:hypothetical protein
VATAYNGNTAGLGWGTTSKDNPVVGTCGVITVQIREYVVGSPGIYAYLPLKKSAYGGPSVTQKATKSVINQSAHKTDYGSTVDGVGVTQSA